MELLIALQCVHLVMLIIRTGVSIYIALV